MPLPAASTNLRKGRHMPFNIHSIYQTVSPYFRRQRMTAFVAAFSVTDRASIVDSGGTCANWSLIDRKPRLVMVNICPPTGPVPKHVRWVIADARALPFADRTFHIAFSNSVIEHLSDEASQRQFAAEVTRVAPAYYVQTPNRFFPIDPHLLTPLFQFLPKRAKRALARNFTVWGLLTRPSAQQAVAFVDELRLLTRRQFAGLFPGAVLKLERWCGFTKSFSALKTHSHA
jgi:hypothetical protein